MSFDSQLTLNSKFFNEEERNREFGKAVYDSAQKFRRELQQKMMDSNPRGRVDIIGEGTEFEARFKRSRKGQRPAIQTRRLLNSYRAKKTGPTSAETSVIAETDEGFDYGEYLQEKLQRQVMTEKDRDGARKDFNRRQKQALQDLI